MKLLLDNFRIIALFIVVIILLEGSSVECQVTLSGFVKDSNGLPVVGADLDFIDVVTGIKLFTPGDNTDVNGFYKVTVLNSTFYDVTFAPPPGTNLRGKRFNNFDLTTSKALDIVLITGLVIQGTVKDSLGNAIGNVNFAADDFQIGRVFTPDDKSDLFFGKYWAVVPPGTFRLRWDPPLGGFLQGFQIDSIDVSTDTVINVILPAGNILTGKVSDISGSGIADVDIELRDMATGSKQFISKNTTDSLGQYRVVTPSGLFNLRFSPRQGIRFVGVSIDSFTILGDMIVDQILEPGVLLTARVTDSLGTPLQKANIDIKLPSTGAKLFTPNDKTDSSGTASVAIQPGVYIVQVSPPPGSLFDKVIVSPVTINADTTMNFVLPEQPRITLSGKVENISGIGLADVAIDLVRVSTGIKQFVSGNKTDSVGLFQIAAPVGLHNVLVSPPVGSRMVARVLNSIQINIDTMWNPIVLDSGIQVTVLVTDAFGLPVDGGDIDLIDELTMSKVFTPHDNINAQGVARAIVKAGRYTVTATPLAGSSLSDGSINGITIVNDTTLTIMLPLARSLESGHNFVLDQNYPNPFTSSSTIRYSLLSASNVSITIYNILGQEVAVLKDQFQTAGQNLEVVWSGEDERGNHVAAGVYFYRIKTPQGSETKKLTLVR